MLLVFLVCGYVFLYNWVKFRIEIGVDLRFFLYNFFS